MRALENLLPVPRVDVGQVAAWFEDDKTCGQIDLLVNIIAHVVPVKEGNIGDLDAVLQYGNHRLVRRYNENISFLIGDDVQLGRGFVFSRFCLSDRSARQHPRSARLNLWVS